VVGKAQRNREIAPVLEVEHDAFLAAIDRGEERAVVADPGSDVPIVVAVARLNLDNARAEIAEQHRRARARHHAREVDDGDAVERSTIRIGGHRHSGFLPVSECSSR
jgi:hypothetical protein